MQGTIRGNNYIPTECVQHILRTEWPKSDYEGRPDAYQERMRTLQVELITCHFSDMDDATKARAESTVAYLASPEAAVYALGRISRFLRKAEAA